MLRSWRRVGRRGSRAFAVALELTRSAMRDIGEGPRNTGPHAIRVEQGEASRRPGGRVAIYAHYSATDRIHPMVLRQVGDYKMLGFDVVFVTMSRKIAATDWQSVRRLSVLLVARRSLGRDFGAWKDALAPTLTLYPHIDELLLANDSVLGPIRPIEPILGSMRRLGPGLVGLTESRQGPPHLQSYFLLAVGRAVVADVVAFLAHLRLSSSRWLMVRRGEYALTAFMQRRGHAARSLISDAAISEAVSRADRSVIDPINPTHHGWRVLVDEFDFPFIKTDLILRNPNRVSDALDWPSVLREAACIDADTIADYLAHAGGGGRRG